MWAPKVKKSSHLVMYFPSLPIYRSSFRGTCKMSPGPSVRKHVQRSFKSLSPCEPLLSQFHWVHLIVKVLPSREKKKKDNWRSAKGSLQSRSDPGGLRIQEFMSSWVRGLEATGRVRTRVLGDSENWGGDLLESAIYLRPLSHAWAPSAIPGLRLIDSAKSFDLI